MPPENLSTAHTQDDPAMGQTVRILAVSDEVNHLIYSDRIRPRFGAIDLVLSCGDLPYSYLDFIVSMLDVPLYGVRGNHDDGPQFRETAPSEYAWDMMNLHGRVIHAQGLLLAGLGGSRFYNGGPMQFTERQMAWRIALLAPRLIYNRLRHGRFLDILVTHAPPRGIHDQPDRAHQGFAVFRPFLRLFRPRYHLHGHIHVYNHQHTAVETLFHDTTVLNVCGFRELRLVVPRAKTTLTSSHTRG